MPKIFLIKNRLHQQQQRLLESQNLLQQKNGDEERLVPPFSPTPPPKQDGKAKKKTKEDPTERDGAGEDEVRSEVLIENEDAVEDGSEGAVDGDANGDGTTIKAPPEALSLPPLSDAHQSAETPAPQDLVSNCNSPTSSTSLSVSSSAAPSLAPSSAPSSSTELLADSACTPASTSGKLQRRVQSSRSRSISPDIGVPSLKRPHQQLHVEQDEPLSLVATNTNINSNCNSSNNSGNCNCNCNAHKDESTTVHQKAPCGPTHSSDGHGQQTWPREPSDNQTNNNAAKHFDGK